MSPTTPWSAQLPSDGEAEQLELFYAHLTLGRWNGKERDYVAHLIATLPLSESTRAHLDTQEPSRLLVYRELTRATHRRVLLSALPRAAARMEQIFEEAFADFLAHRGARTHFLRDLTPAFIDYCRTEVAEIPAYVLDLADLEAVRIQVAAAPDHKQPVSFDLDLERGLSFSEAARVLDLSHAVHRLPDDEEDRSIPEAKPTHLLSYRSGENSVRYMELSPIAAQVIRRLISGETLGASVRDACDTLGEPVTDKVLAGAAQVLADLAERRVILGAA